MSVYHPDHYNAGPVECIDALQSALNPEEFAGFCKANAMKYIWREQHKGGTESLRKAVWYLERLIQSRAVPEPAPARIRTMEFTTINRADAFIPRDTVLLDMTHNGDGEG